MRAPGGLVCGVEGGWGSVWDRGYTGEAVKKREGKIKRVPSFRFKLLIIIQ
jgi:hypothetical protein